MVLIYPVILLLLLQPENVLMMRLVTILFVSIDLTCGLYSSRAQRALVVGSQAPWPEDPHQIFFGNQVSLHVD